MDIPKHYQKVKDFHPDYIKAMENLGQVIKSQGPLNQRDIHLVQIAASVSSGSEGATHSHVRRALEDGVTKEEIRHCIMLLTSTIGFPSTMAGLSWANDIIG